MSDHDIWLKTIIDEFEKQKSTAEKAISQLTDEELHRRPAQTFNSVGTIMRHVGGNLVSRFTEFLTTDGEKPTRDRDSEFADWTDTRAELMAHWNRGFAVLLSSLRSLTSDDCAKTVYIRSQPHSVPMALTRALTHVAYHVGQIVYLSRLLHDGDWKWLTIPPGGSNSFNSKLMGGKP